MSFDITDTVIDQSGEKGSDFTLVNTDSIDDIFNGIEVALIDINKNRDKVPSRKGDKNRSLKKDNSKAFLKFEDIN